MKDLIEKFALANAYSHEGKAQPGAVVGQLINVDSSVRSKMKKLMPEIKKIISKINKWDIKKQEKRLREIYPEFFVKEEVKEKELKELPKAKMEKVIMRFEPSPSGALHLGHAYTLGLNSEYCRKYRGKLVIRISDTNPDNIDTSAYSLIPQDAKWVTKNNVWKTVIQSDRLARYYKYAKQVIDKGFGYVCTCDSEKFRKLLLKSRACPCRILTPSEHLKRWKMMLKKGYKQGEAVVRIKTDLDHKNPAMRDWPALRINESKHPRQGKKYRVWPLMNFAVAVDDHDLGITHAIRAKDHRDNEKRQEYLYNYLGWKIPENFYVGMIHLTDLRMSSSKMREGIDAGKYSGWDDIKLATLPAMKRRGYQPEAFAKYSVEVGLTENDKNTSSKDFFKLMDNWNREVLDPKANRYFFVPNPVEISVDGAPKIKEVSIPVHPNKKTKKKIKVGSKIYVAKEDMQKYRAKEVRLLDLYNVKLSRKAKYTSTENKDKIQRIQWISNKNKKIKVLMPNGKYIEGLAEESVADLKPGAIVQFMRFGFCRKDRKGIFWFTHK